MNETFQIFETFDINDDDVIFISNPSLKITGKSVPSYYLILRGIVGNIKIKQLFRGDIFEQDYNYLSLQKNISFSEEVMIKEITDEKKNAINNLVNLLHRKTTFIKLEKYLDDFTLTDLSNVIADRNIARRNKIFFDNLNNEFLNFFYYSYKNNQTIAFLHLYRILEYISYTFPLLYSLKTKDFSKSFDSLRDLFNGDKDKGELKVFKNFILNIFAKEKNYERTTIEIDILSESTEYNEIIFKMLKSICSNDIFESGLELENSRLSIKFTEFSSFIITIRNRFFHLKNSQTNNILSTDIIDAEHFFSLINTKCAYFISLITFEIISRSCFSK
ncbi:hypothetical protein [uncultured Chryseobacterium sp.]|uniref:hypothetical protein n=1 Tax=uncultured Chryseobacterium sp. TaxID=259322 RepID=UPI0025D83A88|nr:hypothetical protein [uncultured Chryseobacterium sp.]